MSRKYGNDKAIELYATRFRRELNSWMRALARPQAQLEKIIVKSRRTGCTTIVAITASTYEQYIARTKKYSSDK